LDSPESLRAAFAGGLARLLGEGCRTGAFILAYNNAAFDAALMGQLAPALAARFESLAGAVRDSLSRGLEPPDPPDDLAVFLRIMALGLAGMPPTEQRRLGPWELQLNPLRAFRPARAAACRAGGLHRPFDPEGFHFNRPWLAPETFWTGDYRGRRLDLFYNKFPFALLHTLVVPDRESERPQLLAPADHQLAWSLAQGLGESLPGVALGWNSLGAFASVNHLHFHLAPRHEPLAIADPRWRHTGGTEQYPVGCLVLDRPNDAWREIERLQGLDRPFNLVYLPGRVYCLARRRQGDYALPNWCGGQAWYELAGGFICFDRGHWAGLDEPTIRRDLALAAPEFDPYE
jgi:diadenosine tetraphosphate (Ap4A) HIT family hydrolase